MCGIVGYIDRLGRRSYPTGRVILEMLEALGRRGPDGSGIALLRDSHARGVWHVRVASGGHDLDLNCVESLGSTDREAGARQGDTLRFTLTPDPGVRADDLERALLEGHCHLQVVCIGERLDLVKQVGSPSALEATYGVSNWRGPIAIGHTRMSTESRIDLAHSQPFWAHGMADVATVHNGHITNYHKLRRHYELKGVRFSSENDSEVIGVYLRDRLDKGRTLTQAMADSLDDLDGSFNYLVACPEGLGVVRDRHGFKPLMLVETDAFAAVATEEQALRKALPGDYRVQEPPPGLAVVFPTTAPVLA
jgi:glutamine phosphoribosylpyrophosphate amidotransferase